jgi:hypothetical protein
MSLVKNKSADVLKDILIFDVFRAKLITDVLRED